MSNNRQSLFFGTSLPVFDKPHASSSSTTDRNQTPYYVDKSDDETIRFLVGCAEKGYIRGYQRLPSICKVSRILRDHTESSYEPQLVCIGPIHKEDPKFKEFEWVKECYLNDLLKRCGVMAKETLEACLQKVKDLISQIRDSYTGVIINCSDVELARMMVMDGCFILEFCFKHQDDGNMHLQMQNIRIAMDLMLLENQVPFVVLQALFHCLVRYVVIKPDTLSSVLDTYLAPYIQLFRSLLPEKLSTTDIASDLRKKYSTTVVDLDSTHDHILGYLHKHYQPRPVVADSSYPIHAEASKPVYHSIVALDRSGMNFKPFEGDNRSMTIKFQSSCSSFLPWFWGKPTLLMPTLVISDKTELILKNFIAYEQQLFPDQERRYFTSYAHAMHMLIDTQEDVAKLAESKVLVNVLGSNQEAADMINKIDRNVYVTDSNYIQVFKLVDMFYNGFWPTIRRIYFSNPWNAINLLCGIILFLATMVQTIFTVLQYFH